MAWFVKSFSICILQGLNGKISQAFELSKGTFTQAIQSLYAWWGDHLRLTASVPPAAFAAQNGRNPPLFFPHPQNCKYSSCVLQISTGHCLVFLTVCISKLEIQCGKRDSAGKPSEAGSALRISMNASHVPHSLCSTEQLHSSLFQNSLPAAPFPGAVALLDGNRHCRLLAPAIRFAENRLKWLQTTPAPAVCARGHSLDKLHL